MYSSFSSDSCRFGEDGLNGSYMVNKQWLNESFGLNQVLARPPIRARHLQNLFLKHFRWVRVMVASKIRRVKGLMHVKSVEARYPRVVWFLGKWGASSCAILYTSGLQTFPTL
ncbi:hypothetical protein TNCV_2012041 [Trichonephila clavipes]|nr:hypothetical protein TNCV_2012041 [Trichonephila clavipes]